MDNCLNLYLTLVFVGLIIFLFVLAALSTKKISTRRRNDIYRQLKDIKGNIDLNLNSANRDSLVRLDSVLSKVLQLVKRNKLTCGENLKLARNAVNKDLYEDIWYYHKLRNRIVHENIDVSNEDSKKAYEVYYKFITKLI